MLILVSYLGEQIEKYFGDGSNLGLNINYSYEKNPLGTGGALKNAKTKLQNEFLLMNGDTFLPIDYFELISYFQKYKKIGVITAYDNTSKIVHDNIAIDKSTFIINYSKKNPAGMSFVDAGLMVFRKDVLDLIPDNQVCSLEEEIFPKLIALKELLAFPTSQRFYDMGSFSGLEVISEVF